MSCNMYVSVEVSDGSRRPIWSCVDRDFYNGRRYPLFALLAGVRNYEGIKPLEDPRGLPSDVTETVWNAYHEEPLHALVANDQLATWFTLTELERVDWQRFSLDWNESEFSINLMSRLREVGYENPDMVRIVLWFDDTIADLDRDEQRPITYDYIRTRV